MFTPNVPKRDRRKQKGQGIVEYTFILSLVALALVLAFNSLGLQINDFFEATSVKISAILK